jgi:hypothetical protein
LPILPAWRQHHGATTGTFNLPIRPDQFAGWVAKTQLRRAARYVVRLGRRATRPTILLLTCRHVLPATAVLRGLVFECFFLEN